MDEKFSLKESGAEAGLIRCSVFAVRCSLFGVRCSLSGMMPAGRAWAYSLFGFAR